MDKQRQIRNSVLYFLPVVVSSVIPLIVLPVYTRYLTPADYGIYALAQIWATLLSGFFQFGLNSSYNRNFFKYREVPESNGKLLYSVMFFSLISSSVGLLGTYVFEEMVAEFLTGDASNGHIVTMLLFATIVTSTNVFYLNFFRNSEHVRRYVLYTVAGTIGNAMLGILFVVVYKVGVIGLAYAQLIVALVLFAIMSTLLMRRLVFRFDMFLLQEALVIGYPITFKSMFGVVNQQFDKYMLGLLGTLGGVGVYTIGQNISYISFIFMNALQNVFSPRVYREMFDNEEGGGVLGPYLTPFFYLAILPCVLLALFSEEVVWLLLPTEFQGSAPIITVLSMYYGLMFFGKVTPLQLMYAKRAGITMWLLGLSIMLNVALNIPFIKLWGAVGAAWATLLASATSIALGIYVAQKYFRIHWQWMKLSTILFMFLLIVVIVTTLQSIGVGYGVQLSVKLLFLLGFIFLGNRIGIVTRENLHALRMTVGSLASGKRAGGQ